jgi:hypothetical protein
MQTLETEFKVQDRTLRQLKRIGHAAIYELFGPTGLLYGYEVVVIRIRKEHEAFGRHFPEMESYPATTAWGTEGWSFIARDLAGALETFRKPLAKMGRKPRTSGK